MEDAVKERLEVKPGQKVRVYYKIHEGSKSRVQSYEGTVLGLKGSGTGRTFTVRHAGADNVGVERIFPLFSPNIEKLEIISAARVRRAKLYYLRGLSQKSIRKSLGGSPR